MTNKPRKKVVKAWAVLGNNHEGRHYESPMPFGQLAKNYKGALSVFELKKDALNMNKLGGWIVVPCTIIYEL